MGRAGQQCGIAFGHTPFQGRCRHGGFHARNVDQVFPGNGHTIQWSPAQAVLLTLARSLSFGTRARLGHADEDQVLGVFGGDALEEIFGQIGRVDCA